MTPQARLFDYSPRDIEPGAIVEVRPHPDRQFEILETNVSSSVSGREDLIRLRDIDPPPYRTFEWGPSAVTAVVEPGGGSA